jgi:hypothetical protein
MEKRDAGHDWMEDESGIELLLRLLRAAEEPNSIWVTHTLSLKT